MIFNLNKNKYRIAWGNKFKLIHSSFIKLQLNLLDHTKVTNQRIIHIWMCNRRILKVNLLYISLRLEKECR